MKERADTGESPGTSVSHSLSTAGAGAPVIAKVGWTGVVVIAFAYAIAALPAQLLAPAGGQAMVVSLAAGFALAAMLTWGGRGGVGVWVGAFLVHLWPDASVAGVAQAALLASGAAVQALLGARLTRRFLDAPIPLGRDRDLWCFLLLAGPLACLLASTLGVATLFGFGRLPDTELVSRWLSWWSGDTLGVLLFAPVLLMMLPGERRLQVEGRLRVALPLVVTAVLLSASSLGLERLEEGRARAAVERRMDDVAEFAYNGLPAAIEPLRGIAYFFAASGEVSRKEFATYVVYALRQRGMLGVEWAPRVAHSERASFEDAAGRELGTRFHIAETDDQGALVVGGERDEYFPILYSEPHSLNGRLLGLAQGFRVQQQTAMARARDSGEAAAAGVLRLVRSGRPGVMVIVPVYRSGFDAVYADVSGRRAALRGFVRGVFDIDALFFSLAREAARRGLLFRVTDVTPGEPARVLDATLPDSAGLVWRNEEIEFGGRLWRLEMQPVAGARPASAESQAYVAFSMLAALLVAFATLASAGRNAVTRREVADRTAELERELRARSAAEAALREREEDLDITLHSIADAVMTTDAQGRITRLNAVAERLTGWTMGEARGRQVDEVFRIINEHTRLPAVVPVDEVLLTGEIHGLANHTVLIARDGTERAIADSAAPIRDAAGGLRGVVLVFRDVGDQRAAELALQASEARYRQFIELAPLAVFVQCDGRFAFLNPKAVQLFGAGSAQELIGRTVLDFIHPDSRGAVSEHIRALNVERASAPPLEEKWLRVDDSVFHGEATAVPYEHEGRPGALVLLQDISARREAEEQRDRFFMLSLDLLCIGGTDGYFRRVNPAFSRVLGWSEAELLGRPFIGLVHPDDLAATLAEVEKLGQGEPTLQFENRYRCKDGSWRWLAWKALPQPGGLFYGTAHDTTVQREAAQRMRQLNADLELRVAERSAALETLNEKEQEVRAVLDNLVECVVTIDANGTVHSANPALRKVFGYAPEELVGRNVALLMPAPHHDAHDGYITRYLRTGEARIIGFAREVEGRHRDGHPIPLELTVAEYRIRGAPFFIGTMRDIRERKALIAELTQARADAEQASRAKSAFLATMSHEIRTPMNGVVGIVEVLANSRLSAHQADLVRTIRESAAVLLGIIDDILDFSKIEAGRLEIERAPLSISDLVEGLCNSLVPVAARRGVDIALFVSPEIPERVLSDDVRLRQVLYNLVGNAVKFSAGRPERRGWVSVRAEVVETAPLRVAFRVADNGIGIAPETLNDLFTPFTQAEESTTRRFGGTGLGLAICKRLVDLMNGEIRVESAPGVGSTFTVVLPLELAGEQPVRTLPDLTGVECVIIEGPDLEFDDLRVYLEHAGARVTGAIDEDAALRAVAGGAGPVVVIGHAGQAARQPGVPGVHRVQITRGRRRRARVESADTVTLDGGALRRHALLRAVAVAAGRASPEIFHDRGDEPSGVDETPPPTVAEARAQGRLILVAEDDEINRKVILHQLALLGYAAEVANTGAEALRMWRSGRYALLLTDLHMPEMDGYLLAQTIRREEAGHRRMPILALTANALRGEASRAHATGMDEYLTKPIQLHLLRTALVKWLPSTDSHPRAPGPADAIHDTPPVVDVAVLERLVGDDPETIRGFLADYLASARRLATELRAAAADGDVRSVAAIAHKLKSSSRSIGAAALGDLCAELENAGRAEDGAAIVQPLTRFDECLSAVEASIVTRLEAGQV